MCRNSVHAYDEKIHMLEMLAKFRNEGLFDIIVDDE